MRPENDLQSLWIAAKDAGVTLETARELILNKGYGEWGTSTIKAAVEGRSKELREIILRKVLLEHLNLAESVNVPTAESATSGIEIGEVRAEYQITNWRERALKAEQEIERLRAAIQALTVPTRYSTPKRNKGVSR